MAAGIGPLDYINLKIVKALFSMDAFTLIPGASTGIRSAKQDLNHRYAMQHESFDLLPCDGVYSRGISTGLIYALQFELGYNDSTATGAIGPGTKAGIKAKAQFGVGTIDTTTYFVHLFKAALIFNTCSTTGNENLFSIDFCSIMYSGSINLLSMELLIMTLGLHY